MSQSIQTGTVENFTNSISDGWYRVSFTTKFTSAPLVFAQIQTHEGIDTPGLRLQNVTNDGFDVRMDELVMSNAVSAKLGNLGKLSGPGLHPYGETLGWMAIGK